MDPKPLSARAVIFDMDGVLVDSTEAHFEAWRQTGEWLGTPYARELFDRTFGMHNRQTIPLWLGRAVPDEELLRIADHKENLYRDVARAALKPIPGVIPLIRALSDEGYQLAVGSSGPLANVEVALEVLHVGILFQAISSGDDVKDGKPDPAIFLNAARKLGLAPENCAVIEDAPPGIEAAHRAGMAAIAIPTSRSVDELKAADLVVPTLFDLSPEQIASLISAKQSAKAF